MNKYIGTPLASEITTIHKDRWDYINTGKPAINTNPATPFVTWLNLATGEEFTCIDNTEDANTWKGNFGTNVPLYQGIVETPFQMFDFEDPSSYPGSGTTVYDLGSWGANGVFQNGASYSTTPNKSMHLLGTDDKLQFGDVPQGTVAANFTLEAWCMPNVTHTHVAEDVFTVTDWRALHEIRTGVSGNPGLGLSVGTNGIMAIALKPGNAHSIVSYATSLPSTTFSHIVIKVVTNKGWIYLNGSQVKEGTGQADTMQWRGQCIAYSAYGDFSGKVAVARVYDRPLTDEEILHNYNHGAAYLTVA